MTTETIHIFTRHDSWMARSNDPMMVNIFGTDTLPLPFDSSTDSYEVLLHVSKNKPLAKITIES